MKPKRPDCLKCGEECEPETTGDGFTIRDQFYCSECGACYEWGWLDHYDDSLGREGGHWELCERIVQ